MADLKKALVVGGLPRFIIDTVTPKTMRHGVSVGWHWSIDKEVGNTIPSGCDLVLFFRELVPNATALAKALAHQAKKAGIPFISTERKALVFTSDLQKFGFNLLSSHDMKAAQETVLATNVVATLKKVAPTQPLAGASMPGWLMGALISQNPVELTKEQETELFEISKQSRIQLLVNVTPELAGRWIDEETGRNTRNRNLVQSRVDQHQLILKRGEYVLTHQGAAFGKDGVLQDGQHRLWAIFLSGVTAPMNVLFGQEEGAMRVLDSGKKRLAHENRKIFTGDAASKQKIEIASIFHALLSGSANHDALTEGLSEEYISSFKDSIEWGSMLPSKRLYGTSVIRGALTFAWKTDPAKIQEFAEQVIEGVNVQRGSPAFALRRVLESNTNKNTQAARRELAVKTLRTCLGYLNGETMARIFCTEEVVSFFAKAHGLSLEGSGYRIPRPGDLTARQAAALESRS